MYKNYINNKFYRLCLTELDYKIYSKNKKVLSGRWCDNSNKSKIGRDLKVIKCNSLINDQEYLYLQKLLDFFSKKIRIYLNKYHKVNYSQKYWDVLILPWLMTYLPCQFSRWKIVKEAKKINKNIEIVNFSKLQNLHPITTLEYLNLIKSNDIYNYSVFKKILEFFNKKKLINLRKFNSNFAFKKNYFLKKYFFNLLPFYFFVEKINFFLGKMNKLFLDQHLFGKKLYFKISLALKQLPVFLFNRKLDYLLSKNIKINYKKRELVNSKNLFYYKDNFKLFINQNFIFDIPLCFLEGYDSFYQSIKNIKNYPKIVFSGFQHYHNERFKFWLSKNLEEKKTKLIVASHGGGNQLKFSSCLQFEKKIVTKKIVWTKPRKKKEIQMTPIKFIKNNEKIVKKKYLLFLEEPVWKFPVRFEEGSNFSNLRNVLIFKKKLKKNIFDKLKYLPSADSMLIEKEAITKLIKTKYNSESLVFHKFKKLSKLTVCTFPETAFLESIINGPTILINDFKKKPIIFCKDFNSSLLEKNLISFKSPLDAVKHINKIWDHIDEWWEQKSIKLVIEKLRKCLCKHDVNPYQTWLNYIINEKNEVFKN